MFFIRNGYCTVWKITPSEKYTDLQISTSEKNQNGEYVNSRWLARCVGKAHNQAPNLRVGGRATIKTGKVTNESYKKGEETRSFLRVIINEFDMPSANPIPEVKKPVYAPATAPKAVIDEEDEDLPF